MIILGTDESRRGPVLGPLIITGVTIDEKDEEKLKSLGVKDSKKLTKKKREELYPKILKKIKSHKIIEIWPPEIDNALQSQELNLNWLEAHKTAEIINALKPDKAFIDCPSPNKKRYEDYLRNLLDNKEIELVVEHKAEKYVTVAAASIISKVYGDNIIKELQKKFDMPLGPGYMSNKITQEFLKENWEKHPEIFRKSWISWKNHKEKKEQKTLDNFQR
ncbi:MAG: ribonuclease HII [Candidatus Woesearchaeota archaeon]